MLPHNFLLILPKSTGTQGNDKKKTQQWLRGVTVLPVHGVNDTVESDSEVLLLLPQNQYNKKRNLRQQEYL